MKKLALSDEILLSIEKPARYIGNEVNMVRKDTDSVDIRFGMCFPDVYEIGMSHLGMQILYDMFNRREDIYPVPIILSLLQSFSICSILEREKPFIFN